MSESLLTVDNLTVAYPPYDLGRHVLRNLSLSIRAGACTGIIGESGSGKSTIALSILHYLGAGGRYVEGDIRLEGQSLLQLTRRERRSIYGRKITHVAQDPAGALNPSMRIGAQLMESMAIHLQLTAAERRERAIRLLKEVRLRNPEELLEAYPHHLSGGMQQRVCIAMALSCDPTIVIMDEPTTGLDAVTEAAILRLLKDLKKARNLAIIFISHNLAAVAGLADDLAIMYGGSLVEFGPAADVFARPAHRYTQMLLDAVPRLFDPKDTLAEIPWQEAIAKTEGCAFRDRCDLSVGACAQPMTKTHVSDRHVSYCVRWNEASKDASRCGALTKREADLPSRSSDDDAGKLPVLRVEDLIHEYGRGVAGLRAVDDVSFSIGRGEFITIIGESGSGKSTLARNIVGLLRPTSGRMLYAPTDPSDTGSARIDLAKVSRYPSAVARRIQIVFQNIGGSLHPRKSIEALLSRPYRLYERRPPKDQELRQLIDEVGLKTALLRKRASALSGGERQRSALARAYAPQPTVLILDEAFSALDASMKVRVARLLLDKKEQSKSSVLLITHDLAFVPYISDRVLVMYRGWVCDEGDASRILQPPYHPYTETLIWSALELEGKTPKTLDLAKADAPSASSAQGCRFASRCPRKIGSICDTHPPPKQLWDGNRSVICHISIDELETAQRHEYDTYSGNN